MTTIDETRAAELSALLEKARDMIAALTAALEGRPQGPWTYATSIETRGLPGSTPGQEPAAEREAMWHVAPHRFAHLDYAAAAAAQVLKIAAAGGNDWVAVQLIKLDEAPEGGSVEARPPWPGRADISAPAR